jgi:zinc protease
LVYEEELATSISTQSDTRVEGGVFWLLAECAQNADPRELERVLDEELERLRREPPSAKELARVRAVLRASEAFENETASDFAERLGEYAVDAHWKLALESLEHVLAVDAKAVRDCAARLLAPERRVVGWCTPKATPPKAPSRRKSARRGAKQ